MSSTDRRDERRRSRRRPILESFALFAVAPQISPNRLPVFDISEFGLGFQLEPDLASPELTPVRQGDLIDLRLYLNQSLSIPLRIELVRVYQSTPDGPRMAGASLVEVDSPAHQALGAFVRLIDAMATFHD